MKRSDIKKLTKEFSLMVRTRVKHCENGGLHGGACGGVLQCSHIYSVGAWKNLQFHPLNATSLCTKHHLFWWHRDIPEASAWIRIHTGYYWPLLEHARENFSAKQMTVEQIRTLWKDTKGWWA